jgi:hypothetical protein
MGEGREREVVGLDGRRRPHSRQHRSTARGRNREALITGTPWAGPANIRVHREVMTSRHVWLRAKAAASTIEP